MIPIPFVNFAQEEEYKVLFFFNIYGVLRNATIR